MMGLPLMPCTMPPVASSRRVSVTRSTMLLAAGAFCWLTWVTSTVYSCTPPVPMVLRMVAAPVWTDERVPMGKPSG